MALVTLNGVGVISGTVTRPLQGVWTADLVVDSADGLSGGKKATLEADGGYSLTGVIDPDRTGVFLDATHVRLIGGAGGLSKASTARSYIQPGAYVKDVVNGLCSDAGETLSTTTDAAFLNTNLSAWAVVGGNSVARNLRALLDIVNAELSCRILSDGKLWIGTESWPSSSTTIEIISQDPKDGSMLIGMDSPFIEPGMSLPDVGNVGMVADTIESGRLRSRVWLDFPNVERGTAAAVQTMARQALAGVDYYATYVFQVVSQSADLATVDVSPVGARNQKLIGGMQRVTARYLSGTKVQVSPGTTCLLGWDGGNPEGPFALILSGDSAISMTICDGVNHAARVGDSTSGHVHAEAGNAGPYPIVGTTATATDTIAENGGKVKMG